LGPQKQIEAVTIGEKDDDSDLCRSDIIEAINRVDSGDGVAILTDMFGGSCLWLPTIRREANAREAEDHHGTIGKASRGR
jgi:hypothetical protein